MAQEARRPSFTPAERDRRWARMRDLMGQQNVDVLVVIPQALDLDARYVANRSGTVVFPGAGEPTLLTWRPEPARPASWVQDVRAISPGGSNRTSYGHSTINRLRELGAERKRVAIAGLSQHVLVNTRQPDGYVSYALVKMLQDALPQTTFVDGTSILAEARYVKSEEEIEILRRSVEISEASVDVMAERARPGVSEAEVWRAMLAEQFRLGADTAHVAWVGGVWGKPGPRSVTSPPPGMVQIGTFVNNEIEAGVLGYTSQVDQPLCVGPVPPLAKEAFELSKAAIERASEVMRPGVTWGDVEARTQDVAKGTKFKIEFLCHGRGFGHDGPLISPVEGHEHVKNEQIRANTVFILKPYAYPAEHSNYDGVAHHWDYVGWGDSVVVRDNGVFRLGKRPCEVISVS